MKTSVRHLAILLAATAMCQAGLALAEDFYFVSDGAPAAGKAKAAATEQAPCYSCGEAACCDQSCGGCGSSLGCDACPGRGIVGFAGFDAFKGVSDGTFNGNFGAVTGLNSAFALGDSGFDGQLGISYGVYDLDGRNTVNTSTSQQQIFVTTGFFRKADCDRRLSFGLVYDWMFNDEWGVYGTSPTLGQWRGQVEYALSGCNAVGVYGSIGDLGYNSRIRDTQVTLRNRAISQVNFFWHHKFCMGADSWLWVGAPERERITGQGSLGDWIVGASVQAPLSERLALYGNAQYMHPSAAAGANAAVDSGYNVGMGVVWYFGGNAVSHAINGKCNMPYMPVANNSTFMVDQNVTN